MFSRSSPFLALASAVVLLAVLAFPGWAVAGGAKTALFPEYVLADTNAATVTKSDVTVTLESLGASGMYEHPELFAFDKDRIPEQIVGGANFGEYFDKDWQKQYWCYTFGVGEDELAVFRVTIKNGTDHILRMKDPRIYIEIEDRDPIAAVTALGNPTLVPVPVQGKPTEFVLRPASVEADENTTLVYWVTYFELKAEQNRKKHTILDSAYRVPLGIRSQVIAQNKAAYKLISGTDTEILPGKTYKGILLFPVLVSFATATVSFYDVHTKVDAAGTPTEKQTFMFPVKLDRVQMVWDKKQQKRWVRM